MTWHEIRLFRNIWSWCAQAGSSSGITATIEPRVLDDLGVAVSLLKTLARTRLPKEEQKHAITVDQLRACKVPVAATGAGCSSRPLCP